MSNAHILQGLMFDAFRQAEHLAHANPDSHAVIYKREEEGNITRVFVRLPEEGAPEGASVVTTVSRKPAEKTGDAMSLYDAVNHVVSNLPVGVELLDKAVVEHYPQSDFDKRMGRDRQVFAIQFMSTEYRNVATWIPDVAIEGALMQTGNDGRGRVWKNGTITGESTRSIDWAIEKAREELKSAPAASVEDKVESSAKKMRP